jgi:DNA polymerase III delta prime subunit
MPSFSLGVGKRSESMLILNNSLRLAIHKIATCPVRRYFPGMLSEQTEDSELLEMSAPYHFLHLHRDPLIKYAQSAPTSLATMIEGVIKYVETNYAAEYAEADKLMSEGKTTIRHLDKMFHPGQLVTEGQRLDGSHVSSRRVFVVKSWPEIVDNMLAISIWNWTFDGWILKRNMINYRTPLPVEDQDELIEISKLSWHPTTYSSNEIIELIRKRGKKFWTLLQPNFIHCHNENYSEGYSYIKPGRYMIDFVMHNRLHGGGVPDFVRETRNKQIDRWRLRLDQKDTPTEDEFLLMPTTIPGYDLIEKEWVKLPVSNITPIVWNKQPFEDLVLPEDTKHLVKAMVTVRASTIKSKREKNQESYRVFDVIPGKGNGLIMLFHGSPGTGKTLTAESVAEMAEMPLYPITCGDIGTEPDKVEQYLQLVFMLGKRWNCVLLLDEADVFLEERSMTDLQRNSLVSIFLRMLEYYEGILILTSNRVGSFDEAFRSRINIALHYEDLNARSRKQIWNNFLARLELTDEGDNAHRIRDRVDELARHNINGREIRNALSTARQLASYEGVKMDWEHLQLAIKTANDFGKYLKEVHGHSDRDWARETRTR